MGSHPPLSRTRCQWQPVHGGRGLQGRLRQCVLLPHGSPPSRTLHAPLPPPLPHHQRLPPHGSHLCRVRLCVGHAVLKVRSPGNDFCPPARRGRDWPAIELALSKRVTNPVDGQGSVHVPQGDGCVGGAVEPGGADRSLLLPVCPHSLRQHPTRPGAEGGVRHAPAPPGAAGRPT